MKQELETIPVSWIIQACRKKFHYDVSYLFEEGIREIKVVQDRETHLIEFQPPIAGDARFYQHIGQLDWYYKSHKSEYLTASRFSQGVKVVDVGCGEGAFHGFARAAEFVGLELNEENVDAGRKRGIDIRKRLVKDHVSIDQRGGYYDLATAFQVVEHVPDPVAFIKEIAELVRSGGLLFISVPANDSYIGLCPNNILNMPPHHVSRWPDTALQRVGEACGLEVVEVIPEALDHGNERAVVGAVFASLFFSRVRFVESGIRSSLRALLIQFTRVLSEVAINRTAASMRGHSVSVVLRKPVS
jgi:2-polyprenyl-3-methyl-5-hydroxy-6-metoxy-1,4-benzoquinol methylase